MISFNTRRSRNVATTCALYFFMLMLPILLHAQGNYHIEGRFALPDSTQVELGFPHSTLPKHTLFMKDGQFSYSGTVDGPREMLVFLTPPTGRLQARMMYVDSGRMVISGEQSLGEASIDHSPINDAFKEYKKIFEDTDAAPAHAQWKYIQEHPNSFFSLVALEDLAAGTMDHLDSIEQTFNQLGADVKQTKRAAEFASWLTKNKTLAPGRPIPNLAVKDRKGKTMQLSELKGKYTLVHFWASWCPGCRDQAPYFRATYDQYAKNGLDIVYVTLDDSAHIKAWKDAITKDKVDAFTHTKAELNDVYRLFNITGIPLNFLIDPNGCIVMSDTGTEKIARSVTAAFGH